jgi:hypothetical protein
MITTITTTVIQAAPPVFKGWEVALCILAGGIALAAVIWAFSKLMNGG